MAVLLMLDEIYSEGRNISETLRLCNDIDDDRINRKRLATVNDITKALLSMNDSYGIACRKIPASKSSSFWDRLPITNVLLIGTNLGAGIDFGDKILPGGKYFETFKQIQNAVSFQHHRAVLIRPGG